MVRQDPKVKDTIRHQTPILMRSPNTDAAEDVVKISRGVIKELADAKAAATA
jgi:flagellar biosynthesis protein FlhG